MAQKARGKTRRGRGRLARITRVQNKNLTPASLRNPRQSPLQHLSVGDPETGTPLTKKNDAPPAYSVEHEDVLATDSTQIRVALVETISSYQQLYRQKTARRPCTRSQTAAEASTTVSHRFSAGTTSLEDTYARYYPIRNISGFLETPPQNSKEESQSAFANVETVELQHQRGKQKRKLVDYEPLENQPRRPFSKSRRLSCASYQTNLHPVTETSGISSRSGSSLSKTRRKDESTKGSKPKLQQETFRNFKSPSPRRIETGQAPPQKRQSKGRVPRDKSSCQRAQVGQMFPLPVNGVVNQTLNDTRRSARPPPFMCEAFVHNSASEKASSLLHFEAVCASVDKELPQELVPEKPRFFFSKDLPEPSVRTVDHDFSPLATGQTHFRDESESRSPSSAVKWKQKVITALGTCIPEAVIREAATAPPVVDFPKGSDSSVLCDQYLQVCSRILSSRMPGVANFAVAVSVPVEDDIDTSATTPAQRSGAARILRPYLQPSNGAGRPTLANSTIPLSDSFKPRRPLSSPSDAPYAQAALVLAAPRPKAVRSTACTSRIPEKNLKLCQMLLQKYKSHVLSRPYNDRWRHLF